MSLYERLITQITEGNCCCEFPIDTYTSKWSKVWSTGIKKCSLRDYPVLVLAKAGKRGSGKSFIGNVTIRQIFKNSCIKFEETIIFRNKLVQDAGDRSAFEDANNEICQVQICEETGIP